jgi:hypothetical protein
MACGDKLMDFACLQTHSGIMRSSFRCLPFLGARFPGGLSFLVSFLVAFLSWWPFFPGGLSFLLPFLSWWPFFPGGLSFLLPFLSRFFLLAASLVLASFWHSLFADRHVIFVDTTGSKSYWILLVGSNILGLVHVMRAGNLQRAEWRWKCRQMLADHLSKVECRHGDRF